MSSYRIEEIAKDVYVLRVNDRISKYFEALWEIPEGITYNAYLIKGPEGAILIDGWKPTYAASFIAALETLVSPEELKYVVVNHLEPDHSGSLEDVLRWAPEAKVLGSKMAARLVAPAFPRARKRFQAVQDGEERVLAGRKFRFIYTPWLHWPETMVTWLEDERILFTTDVFGGFGLPDGIFDDQCAREEDIMRSMKKYLVTVVGHYRKFIIKGLEKIKNLGIEPRIIAPGHGLLWRGNPSKVIEYYRSLAEARPVPGKVLVLYASMYGTMEQIARAVACELRMLGMKPVMYGFTDTTRPLVSEILADAIDAEHIVIACPTYEAGIFPYMRFIVEELCLKASAEKPVTVLGTYGWGGVAARLIGKKLEECGFKVLTRIEDQSISPRHNVTERERIMNLARVVAKKIYEQSMIKK